MTDNTANNKRIAKNTLMLYIRMFCSMVVSFYTSRVILDVLGITDYGINNVVAGTASLFSFINASLAGATSRFLIYDLGKNNLEKLKKTFSATITIHVVVALLIFILCETIGLYLINNKLVIPEDRLFAAHIIFQLSVLSTMVSITQVPYNAAIIAHEKMGVFAVFGIADVCLKLLIVFMLEWFTFDKLILYGILFFILSVGMMACYRLYGYKHFPECRFRLTKEKKLLKPLLVFSGWDLYGNMCVTFAGQGINIIQNMFWGPAINAATGIANHVVSAIMGFSRNFNTAINPQIVKNYAVGNYTEMIKLASRCSRFSFYLLFLISFPAMLKLNDVLTLWLVEVPAHTYRFCQLVIIFNWIDTLLQPLLMIIHATGRMKLISFISGTLYLLIIPTSYCFLSFGAKPSTPFLVSIGMISLVYLSNLFIVKHYIHEFPVIPFLKTAVMSPIMTTVIGALIPLTLAHFLTEGWLAFFIVCSMCVICEVLSILYIGLNINERKVVLSSIKSRTTRFSILSHLN